MTGAALLKLLQIGPCGSVAIGSANGCERTKFVFAVTSFLGDITRFFETGNVFKIYQRPVDTVFATVQIGF